MTDYIEIIKNQFFSNDNIEFIIKVLNNKQVYINSNKTVFDACNQMFNKFMHTIYTQKKQINPVTIEDLLVTLNKMTIDLIIENNYTNPQTHIIQNTLDVMNENVSIEINKVNPVIKSLGDEGDINNININNTSIIHDKEHNTSIIHDKENIECEQLYLFSEDSEFKNGEYHFEFRRKNIKKITLKSMEIINNLYNINESNNIIEITEKNIKKIINIPVGCYSLHNLIENLQQQLKDKSLEKINIMYDKNKNQISLKGETPFSVSFIENDNIFIPLRFMLGFDKKDYINNNTYSSTNTPVINIYDSIYMKITTQEYSKLFNKKWSKDFNFYNKILFNQINTFGQDVNIELNNHLNTDYINIDDIHMELYYRHINHRKFYKINKRLKFLMTFDIEYLIT
jgi:hypothetical protein